MHVEHFGGAAGELATLAANVQACNYWVQSILLLVMLTTDSSSFIPKIRTHGALVWVFGVLAFRDVYGTDCKDSIGAHREALASVG